MNETETDTSRLSVSVSISGRLGLFFVFSFQSTFSKLERIIAFHDIYFNSACAAQNRFASLHDTLRCRHFMAINDINKLENAFNHYQRKNHLIKPASMRTVELIAASKVSPPEDCTPYFDK